MPPRGTRRSLGPVLPAPPPCGEQPVQRDEVRSGVHVVVRAGQLEQRHRASGAARERDMRVRRTRPVPRPLLRAEVDTWREPQQRRPAARGRHDHDVGGDVQHHRHLSGTQEWQVAGDHQSVPVARYGRESRIDGTAQQHFARRTVVSRWRVGDRGQTACVCCGARLVAAGEHPDVDHARRVERGEHVIEHREHESSTRRGIERIAQA